MKRSPTQIVVPGIAVVVGLVLLLIWPLLASVDALQSRVPGLDRPEGYVAAAEPETPTVGEPVRSEGQAADLPGTWPWLRGTRGDGICDDGVPLARKWPQDGPKKLWSVPMGQGYAAAAVDAGCVYVLDYDNDALADTMRCLSLADGREIWRNSYPVTIKQYHGMSRTVPAIVGEYLVSLGPKCHVVGWNAQTGESRWMLDLVLDYGTKVPQWYAGQCPLIDGDRLILAPGGDAMLMAVDYRTGEVIWKSENPRRWAMTHVSIVPMEFAGRRMYVYCGKGGVAGVAADTGEILWDTTAWRIGIATCPTPIVLPDGKIFCSGGYNAGAVLLQLEEQDGQVVVSLARRFKSKEFGSTQQTPILFDGHLYGVRERDKQLVCLDLDGNEVWRSGAKHKFGEGPYLIADGLIYILDDDGVLTMAEATTDGYKQLDQARILNGHDAWGPMAMVGGLLILRDFTTMACIDVSAP